MVSVKGSEIKEISERAGAREERELTGRERENAEGATRVLEALGGAGTAEARRALISPADPVCATFVPLGSGDGEFAPSSGYDTTLATSSAVDRRPEWLGAKVEP